MLKVIYTYQESQDVLYLIREEINNTSNLKYKAELEHLNDKIDKAIKEQYKNSYEYHRQGELEKIANNVEDFRVKEMVERVRVG
jgi:hypothetical protein